MTIESFIAHHAAACPDKMAIVCGQEHCTYRQLLERVSAVAAQMSAMGFQQGRIVCLRAHSSVDFLVRYFACHLIGCVAAPLGSDMPEAAFAQLSALLSAHSVPEGSADILYTTGTTGSSKGVVISHQAIIANAENLIDGQRYAHQLAFVINGPLNHIGSLSKVYPMIMLGGTIIIVDGLKDMNKFFDALAYSGATQTATFLVPASIRILLQLGAERLSALSSKIAFIETGAAAISHADMLSLCRLLPHTQLYNTYASTETGIISTYDYNDSRCLAGCLGRPMRHSHIIITREGKIACKGKTLMTGYVGDPQRTSAVLSDGTVYTSDTGFLDAEGMLHLTGRADDVINVGGFKVAPSEVENAALSFPDVQDCVCIAAPHPITVNALKLLVVMREGKPLNRKALALHLKTLLESHKIPLLYAETDRVERTFNGKINRKYYK